MNNQEFFAKFQDAINAEIALNIKAKEEYDSEQNNPDSGYEWQYLGLQPEDIYSHNGGLVRALEILKRIINSQKTTGKTTNE